MSESLTVIKRTPPLKFGNLATPARVAWLTTNRTTMSDLLTLPATLTFHKLSESKKSACVSIKAGLTSGNGTVGYVDAKHFAGATKGQTFEVDPSYTIETRKDKDGVVMAHESTNEDTGEVTKTPYNYFVW